MSISGSLSAAEDPRLRDLGFDEFLPKPFGLVELHRLIKRVAASGMARAAADGPV